MDVSRRALFGLAALPVLAAPGHRKEGSGMPWQTAVTVQLQAGNTIINPNGMFVYSSSPGAGNLKASVAPSAGTDSFGNSYLAGVTAYGSAEAVQSGDGFVSFYTGSLAGGWTAGPTIFADGSGNLTLTGSTIFIEGSSAVAITGSTTINGSGSTGNGSNGGVTSGPSGTVSSFPAAGPNHTHAEVHNHPL